MSDPVELYTAVHAMAGDGFWWSVDCDSRLHQVEHCRIAAGVEPTEAEAEHRLAAALQGVQESLAAAGCASRVVRKQVPEARQPATWDSAIVGAGTWG